MYPKWGFIIRNNRQISDKRDMLFEKSFRKKF